MPAAAAAERSSGTVPGGASALRSAALLIALCAAVRPAAAAPPAPPPLGPFALLKDYSGQAFFDGFEFFVGNDPTKGCVDFVNESTALATGLAGVDAASGQVFMRVDHTGAALASAAAALDAAAAAPPVRRRSVRVTSASSYDPKNISSGGASSGGGSGAVLTVLDLAHMPTGCATWPAFWMDSGKGKWPQFGEIDIIEGVHDTTRTQTTLHTTLGCQQSEVPTDSFTGEWKTRPAGGGPATNCYIHAYSPKGNLGCPIGGPPESMGAPFNTNGGGIYAMLWTHHADAAANDEAAGGRARASAGASASGPSGEKSMWFFDREHIPADLKPHLAPPPAAAAASSAAAAEEEDLEVVEEVAPPPDPSSWGKPYAQFWSDATLCPAAHFEEQRIIFDITLCGGWAGGTFAAACPAFAPANATTAESHAACEAFVANNPAAFAEAYWTINSLKIFSATGKTSGGGSDGGGGVFVGGRGGEDGEVHATLASGRSLLQELGGEDEELHQVHVHREKRELPLRFPYSMHQC